MPLTLTTGECGALADHLDKSWNDERLGDLPARLRRAATPRQGSAAGKRFERRVANELREIVAQLDGEWKVSRNQTDRQKGQVADGAGEFTIEGPRPWPWCFELKDGSGFKLEHLLTHPCPTPLASTPRREGFWAQAARQAATVGRRPVLIVREAGDHHREFVLLRPLDRIQLTFGNRNTPVLLTVTVDGEPLDVLFWYVLRRAHADRWLDRQLPSPPVP